MQSAFKWLGKNHDSVPLLITVPHSGESIPDEAAWLVGVPTQTLLTDIDRFVDQLYAQAAVRLPLPLLATEVHRYCVDLNRYPGDVDRGSVQGAGSPAGTFPHGFHWVRTTGRVPLIQQPISGELHDRLTVAYHDRFHEEIGRKVAEIRTRFPGKVIYHFDCHSMPSIGNESHKDAGRVRPQVCLSDFNRRSASAEFLELTRLSFTNAGFGCLVNWPYQGGRITQRYGKPAQGMETVQIELNRSLYMNEVTREKSPAFADVQARLSRALLSIVDALATRSP